MVLVPTSSETLSQFKRRGLLMHTVPLELAVQLSILQWAHFPTPRFTSWQSYSTVTDFQIESAGTFSVSKVRLLLPTRCTDTVQILNPVTPLFWPMEWAESVCLGSTRDRTSCQSLSEQSSWAATKHVQYILNPNIRFQSQGHYFTVLRDITD